MTVGSGGLANTVVRMISERVKVEIFSNIENDFTKGFVKLVNYSIGVMSNALRGDVKDLEQVHGFAVSFKIAHDVAGIIAGIHKSKVAERCFEAEHVEADMLNRILEVAASDAPMGLLPITGTDFARASGAVDGSRRRRRWTLRWRRTWSSGRVVLS